jgi:hypothetical protein
VTPAKAVSLGSAATLRMDGHPHDYRRPENRALIRAAGVSTVKIWVSWWDLQAAHRPGSRHESWDQLNTAPGDLPAPFSPEPALRNLDRQIAAANADGLTVVLALDEYTPPWANSARLPASQGLVRYAGRESDARPPRDRSPTGPWAWFIEHLCARYRRTPANPIGPPGNPDGAYVAALELFNEPNVRWPQPGACDAVAEMMRTAADLAAVQQGPALLVPSLSDHRRVDLVGQWGPGTPFGVFARELLTELGPWERSAPVGWSQHNYGDMASGRPIGVVHARDVLEHYGWHDASLAVWLTEGAAATPAPASCTLEEEFARERLEAQLIERNHERMSRLPGIHLWTYHTLHDLPTDAPRLGLLQAFDVERGESGPEKLAWEAFAKLPGGHAPSLPAIDADELRGAA